MSDEDSSRQSPGPHHVLGRVGDILWIHAQVGDGVLMVSYMLHVTMTYILHDIRV